MQSIEELSPPIVQILHLVQSLNSPSLNRCERLVHSLDKRIQSLGERFATIHHRLQVVEARNAAVKDGLRVLHARLKHIHTD